MQEEERAPQIDYSYISAVQRGGDVGVNTLSIMGYGIHIPNSNGGGTIHQKKVEVQQYFCGDRWTPYPDNQHIQTISQGKRAGVQGEYGARVGKVFPPEQWQIF